MYFVVSDTLDIYLEYISGPFTVTPGGDLEYTELLGAGDILSLPFNVQVQEDAPIGYFIDNTAWITAYTDPLDIAGTTIANFEAIAPQARIASQDQVIPEPSTLLLFGIGMIGISLLIRRKLRK